MRWSTYTATTATSRWGREVFEKLFVKIIRQCVEAGLVSGEKIHVDGSLVEADASRQSVVKGPPELMEALKAAYEAQEKKLCGSLGDPYYQPVNERLMSRTDPDAPNVRRAKGAHQGDSRPRYKNHRVVDDQSGVITAMRTTRGDVEENRPLADLIEEHEQNCGQPVKTVVADRQYGTADNFRKLQESGIRTHMGIMHGNRKKSDRSIYPREAFTYDASTDTYRCPAGQTLYRRHYDPRRQATEYATRKGTCPSCVLRGQCTRAKNGRNLMRHRRQELIDPGHEQSRGKAGCKDRQRRKWLMEGSFGQAVRHHFKRARYRRLWRQQIQDYLIGSVQNIKKLIQSNYKGPNPAIGTLYRNAMSPLHSLMPWATIILSFQAYRRSLRNIRIAVSQRAFGQQPV